MRPHGSPQFLEERRRRVVTFLKQKLSLHEIARRLGCHASSVMRWRDALRSGGEDALKAKPVPGRPPRLTLKQKRQLVRLLTQGAMAHGYRTELWTTQRIADLIERRLGVRYHYNHVGKLLLPIPLIPATHSEGFRPAVPIEGGHLFRFILATLSE